MKPNIKTGDRVAYSARFLRSICDYSHASASKRGTVTGLKTYGHGFTVATIKWDNDNDILTGGANARCLVRVKDIATEAAS